MASLNMRNLAVAAGVALAAATAPVTQGANAQEPVKVASPGGVTATTNCKEYRPGEGGQSAICEVLKGRALDEQAKLIERETACKSAIIDAARRKEVIINFPMPKIGDFCPTANRLGVKVSMLAL